MSIPGQNATIRCRVSSVPRARVRWFRHDSDSAHMASAASASASRRTLEEEEEGEGADADAVVGPPVPATQPPPEMTASATEILVIKGSAAHRFRNCCTILQKLFKA